MSDLILLENLFIIFSTSQYMETGYLRSFLVFGEACVVYLDRQLEQKNGLREGGFKLLPVGYWGEFRKM